MSQIGVNRDIDLKNLCQVLQQYLCLCQGTLQQDIFTIYIGSHHITIALSAFMYNGLVDATSLIDDFSDPLLYPFFSS